MEYVSRVEDLEALMMLHMLHVAMPILRRGNEAETGSVCHQAI